VIPRIWAGIPSTEAGFEAAEGIVAGWFDILIAVSSATSPNMTVAQILDTAESIAARQPLAGDPGETGVRSMPTVAASLITAAAIDPAYAEVIGEDEELAEILSAMALNLGRVSPDSPLSGNPISGGLFKKLRRHARNLFTTKEGRQRRQELRSAKEQVKQEDKAADHLKKLNAILGTTPQANPVFGDDGGGNGPSRPVDTGIPAVDFTEEQAEKVRATLNNPVAQLDDEFGADSSASEDPIDPRFQPRAKSAEGLMLDRASTTFRARAEELKAEMDSAAEQTRMKKDEAEAAVRDLARYQWAASVLSSSDAVADMLAEVNPAMHDPQRMLESTLGLVTAARDSGSISKVSALVESIRSMVGTHKISADSVKQLVLGGDPSESDVSDFFADAETVDFSNLSD
jgi:hypothetical protein